jgi:hypothetical protein
MSVRPLEDQSPTTGAAPPRPRASQTPADLRTTPDPALPRLKFTQVAFAGHNRPEDLGDPAHVSTGLQTAFAMLSQAGIDEARLITGLAPGADLLAAEAWTASGMGPVHGVFPFLDDAAEGPTAELMEAGTWLDGRATESLGRNAYLAQTRWLIGAADLLVVVWTGEHARGAGGTADAVRLALEHGVPVLWIKPGEPETPRLIRPEHLDEDFGFLEFLEELRFGREPLVRDATPEAIHDALMDLGLRAEPQEEPKAQAPAKQGFIRHWRAYAVFRRTLGGNAPPFEAVPTPVDLSAEPGFLRLTQAHAAADGEASQLGAVHRSHQVILLGVAILATIAGTVSGIWPKTELVMVLIELALALGAFLVWMGAERGRRHHRWGETRRLAEDLRLERVAWTLGVNTAPHGANLLSSSAQARRVRREAGLPRGAFGPDRVKAWGDWAVDELIAGQAAYHRGQSMINGRVSHRIHQLETGSFTVLMVILVSYVATTIGMAVFGHEGPHWLAGLVGVAGAIVPAIGATSLALEASLSLGEQAERSRVLARRLEAIVADLGPGASLEAHQAAAKAAIRLQRAQENHWTEGAERRRLIRGN